MKWFTNEDDDALFNILDTLRAEKKELYESIKRKGRIFLSSPTRDKLEELLEMVDLFEKKSAELYMRIFRTGRTLTPYDRIHDEAINKIKYELMRFKLPNDSD